MPKKIKSFSCFIVLIVFSIPVAQSLQRYNKNLKKKAAPDDAALIFIELRMNSLHIYSLNDLMAHYFYFFCTESLADLYILDV